MTLDLMREYIVFAKHLNFSHAARELNLTQSTLSKHIAALEKELGFPVVTRGRELQFTAQGKAFLESAQKVVHLYDAELAVLRESFMANEELVRLHEGIARWSDFLDGLDGMPITFAEMRAGESVVDALEANRMDIGLNFDTSIDSAMRASYAQRNIGVEPIAPVPMGILLSHESALADRTSLSRNDLKGRTFIIPDGAFFDENSAFTEMLFGSDLDLQFALVPISGSLANIDYLHPGDKLFFYEREVLQALCERRSDLMVFETLDGHPLEAPTALFYRRDAENPRISQFIGSAREYFQSR